VVSLRGQYCVQSCLTFSSTTWIEKDTSSTHKKMHLAVPKCWTSTSTYPTRSSLRRVFIGHVKYWFQNDLQGLCQLDHSQLADPLEQTLYIVLRSNFFISWDIMKKIKGLTETFQAIMLHLQTAYFLPKSISDSMLLVSFMRETY